MKTAKSSPVYLLASRK